MYFRMHVAKTASLHCLLFRNFGRTIKSLIPYPHILLSVFLFVCFLVKGYSKSFTEYQFQWVEDPSEFSLDGNRSPSLTLFEHCSYLIRSSGAELSLIDVNNVPYDGDEIFSNQIEGNGEYILLTPNQNTPRQLFYQNVKEPLSVKGHLQIKEYTDLGLIKMNQPTAFSRFGTKIVITNDQKIFTSATGYNQNEGLVFCLERSNDGSFYHDSDQDISSPLNDDAFWGSYLFFDEHEKKLLIGSSNADDFRGSLHAYSLSSMESSLLFQGEKMGDLLGWSFASYGEKLIVSALSVTETTGGYFSLFRTPYTSPLVLHEKVQPSSPQFGSEFGYSLSFDGDRIVIGAPSEDDLIRQDCGAVYLYRMNENTMTGYKILPYQRSDGDRFGHSVRLAGDLIFVGSPYGDGSSPKSGLVHVFKFEEEDLSIEEIYNILPPDGGTSQKFSQNLFTIGDFVFISSPESGNCGVVYVYKQSGSSPKWELVSSIHLDQFSENLSRGDNISLHVKNGLLALGLEKESTEENESGAIQILYNPSWNVSSSTQIPPFFENNTLVEVNIEEDTPEIIVDFNATLPIPEKQPFWEINSSSNALTINDFDINHSSGVFTFTPPSDLFGRIPFLLSVQSGDHNIEHNFEININPVSDAPRFLDFNETGTNIHTLPVATVGETYNYQFALFDADGDELILTVADGELPNGLTIDGDQILGSPQSDGNNTFQLSLSDGTTSILQSFFIESFSENSKPTVFFKGNQLNSPATIDLQFIENFSSVAWSESIESLNVRDDVGQILSVEILEQPNSGFLSVTSIFQEFSNNLLRYTPSFNYFGNVSFALRFTDGHPGKAKFFDLSFNIDILSDNSAPYITSDAPPSTVMEGTFFQHTFEVFDTDEDYYNINFHDLPTWLKFDGVRTIFGKPSRSDFAESTKGFFTTVTDQWGSASTYKHIIDVIPNNYPPVIRYEDTSLSTIEFNMSEDGDPVFFRLHATNPDNDERTLFWVLSQNPLSGTVEILSQNSTFAEFSFTPDGNFSGVETFEIKVFEEIDPFAEDKISVSINILPSQDSPRFETRPYPGIVINRPWNYIIRGIDGDPDDYLTLNSLVYLPEWLRLIQTSNRVWTLTGLPPNLINEVPVHLRLSDGYTSVEQNFTLKAIDSIEDLELVESSGIVFTNQVESPLEKFTSISIEEDSNWTLSTLRVNANEDIRVNWNIIQHPENGVIKFSEGDNGQINDLTYAPYPNFHGSDSFSLEVSDNYSMLLANFNLEVMSQEDPFLFVEYPTGIIESEDEVYDFIVTFKDDDGIENIGGVQSITLPAWMNYEDNLSTQFSKSLRFFGEPKVEHIGLHEVDLVVADSQGTNHQMKFEIRVRFLNKPPLPSPSSITTSFDEDSFDEAAPKLWRNIFSANDEESNLDEMTWSIVSPPHNGTARIDSQGQQLLYFPDANYSGTDFFTVGVYDNGGELNSPPRQSIVPVNITINRINDLPVFRSLPPSSNSGNSADNSWSDQQEFSYEIIVDDSDWSWQGYPNLSLVSSLPSWLNWTDLGYGRALLSGLPQWYNQGSYSFVIEAKSGGDSVFQQFDLNITVDDYPPRIVDSLGETIFSKIKIFVLEDGSTESVTNFISGLRAFNPDKVSGETLRWLAFKQPSSGGSISLSSELEEDNEYAVVSDFNYSIPLNFNGMDQFSLVADEGDRSTEIFFEINVKSLPDPPTFLTENPLEFSVFRGSYTEFRVEADEPDQQTVDFKVLYSSNDPKWLTILSEVNSGNDISVTLGGVVPSYFDKQSISLVATDPTGRFSILPINLYSK